MSNTWLTISMITRRAMMILENNLVFTKNVNRDFDDSFAIAGAKIGDTINIRKPPRYTVRTGTAMSVQNHTDQSAPLVLDTQAGCDISFTSKELTLSLDDFSQRVLEPQIAAVANKIDYDGMSQYVNVANAVGTAGTVPNALYTYLSAGAMLDDNGVPQRMRRMVIGPWMQATIVDALKGLFQSSTEIAKQYREGMMGRGAGFDWFMDQNTVTHTYGAWGSSTPAVNGANQTGSTLNVNGWESGASTLNAGDVFTIAGVFSVNPQSRQSTGQLQRFVVTADTSDAAGTMAALPIYPSITISGAYQTVTGSPDTGALLTILGAVSTTSPQGLGFHRDAFVLGSADLMLPGGVDRAARVSSKRLGLSIRMVRQYDINNDAWPCRLDVLYGWKTVYPELACRVHS
jgi:hypothetical protein